MRSLLLVSAGCEGCPALAPCSLGACAGFPAGFLAPAPSFFAPLPLPNAVASASSSSCIASLAVQPPRAVLDHESCATAGKEAMMRLIAYMPEMLTCMEM